MNVFYLEESGGNLRTEDMGWGPKHRMKRGGLGHTREKGPYLRERLRMRERTGKKMEKEEPERMRKSGVKDIKGP